MIRKKNRFWEYVEELNGCFKCKFCECNFAGGTTRIKAHLARVKGHDIDICKKLLELFKKKLIFLSKKKKEKKIRSLSSL